MSMTRERGRETDQETESERQRKELVQVSKTAKIGRNHLSFLLQPLTFLDDKKDMRCDISLGRI